MIGTTITELNRFTQTFLALINFSMSTIYFLKTSPSSSVNWILCFLLDTLKINTLSQLDLN